MAALAFFPDIERLHVQHDGGVSFLDDMVCGCIGIEDDEPEYVFPQDGKNKEKADEEDGQGKHQRGPAFDDMIGKKANGNGINGDEKSYETCEQCENVDCPQKARGVVNEKASMTALTARRLMTRKPVSFGGISYLTIWPKILRKMNDPIL